MPTRTVWQTATGTVGHWSLGNKGEVTECGAEIHSPAPKTLAMTCGNCSRIVKARQGRNISNAARTR